MAREILINDHFQNYKKYGLHKAQLVIADIPYNIGKNAYGSNPAWYIDGDNKNGESSLAGKGRRKRNHRQHPRKPRDTGDVKCTTF